MELTGVVSAKYARKMHSAVGSLNPFTVRKQTRHGRLEWDPLSLILCRLSCEPCHAPDCYYVKASVEAMENIVPHDHYMASAYTFTQSWGWIHQLELVSE